MAAIDNKLNYLFKTIEFLSTKIDEKNDKVQETPGKDKSKLIGILNLGISIQHTGYQGSFLV
jgi:hypothetical protein